MYNEIYRGGFSHCIIFELYRFDCVKYWLNLSFKLFRKLFTDTLAGSFRQQCLLASRRNAVSALFRNLIKIPSILYRQPKICLHSGLKCAIYFREIDLSGMHASNRSVAVEIHSLPHKSEWTKGNQECWIDGVICSWIFNFFCVEHRFGVFALVSATFNRIKTNAIIYSNKLLRSQRTSWLRGIKKLSTQRFPQYIKVYQSYVARLYETKGLCWSIKHKYVIIFKYSQNDSNKYKQLFERKHRISLICTRKLSLLLDNKAAGAGLFIELHRWYYVQQPHFEWISKFGGNLILFRHPCHIQFP